MNPWLLALLIVGADQLSKRAVRGALAPGGSVPLLPPVLYFTHVQNTGAAFGMLRGHVPLFVLLSLVVAGWIIVELARRRPPAPATLVSLSLILGGAVGNVIDRLRLGYVIDFIDLRVWPVFNVADAAITIGVTVLLWQSFVGKRRGA
ncbi:MAG: signal peptidase II [Candidatus Omnitrophica bacterium]|nr:signal peptidase II [Candidatus Omnitrophota bacterium]